MTPKISYKILGDIHFEYRVVFQAKLTFLSIQ